LSWGPGRVCDVKYPREAGVGCSSAGIFPRDGTAGTGRTRRSSPMHDFASGIGKRPGAKRSARVSAEVGCSPRLAGEARPGFCRECNRRQPHHREARPHHRRLRSRQNPGCLRGQARGTANRTPPPNRQPAARQTPRFPEPGPPEAPLTLTSRRQDNRQEPTRRQAQATARVEDDRREDEQASDAGGPYEDPTRSAAQCRET
jgi:hypothetical protein